MAFNFRVPAGGSAPVAAPAAPGGFNFARARARARTRAASALSSASGFGSRGAPATAKVSMSATSERNMDTKNARNKKEQPQQEHLHPAKKEVVAGAPGSTKKDIFVKDRGAVLDGITLPIDIVGWKTESDAQFERLAAEIHASDQKHRIALEQLNASIDQKHCILLERLDASD